jgi:Ca2+-binding RTX toxin-like protein
VPQDLRDDWDDVTGQAHMVYAGSFPTGYTHTPDNIVFSLLHAFDSSDDAVFLYADSGDDPDAPHWFDPTRADPEWIAAVQRAVTLVDHTRRGDGGDDMLVGGNVANRLMGQGGDDALSGRRGDDLLNGGNGADLLMGGAGRDDLFGGRGRDRLDGGTGADMLTGGAGADLFVLRPGSGHDRVTDFNPAMDRVDASPAASVTVVTGGLLVTDGSASLFLQGLRAGQADDVLLI